MIPLQKGGSDDLRKYTWFFGIMVTYLYRNESNGTVFAIVCRRLIISQGLYVFELALSNEELRFSLVNRSKWFWVVWLNDAQSRLRFEMGRAVDWGVSCVLWLWVVSGWVGGTVTMGDVRLVGLVRCVSGWVGDHPNSSGWDGHPNFERQSFWKVLAIWLESRWKVLGMVEWGVCGATCRWYLEDIQVISKWYHHELIMIASWMQEEWIKIPGTQLMDSERPCGA